MKPKQLIIMVVALAVLAGIALMQRGSGKKRISQTDPGATLFQGLELNTVDGFEVSRGSESVSLTKKAGTWKVESLYDYPADFGRLADALRAASDVKTGSPVRSANVDASEYGLDQAKRVVLKAGGADAAQLDIGTQREASDAAGWANQHFVRKDGSADVYLVDYDFRPFSERPGDWIDKELLNVASSGIVSVKAGDVELKEIEGQWTLAGLNEETEELQTSEAGKLRSALQYLNCSSIADPDRSDEDLGFSDAAVYTASTTNQTITVTVGGEADGGRYVRFSGDVPEKLNGWTYVVSSYKADNFLFSRDKLVKEKEAPPEETGEPSD